MLAKILVFLVILPNVHSQFECGKTTSNKDGERFKIANGDRVESDGKWPWMVAFFRNDDECQCQFKVGDNFCYCCSGTVVGPRHLLSAAHCFVKTIDKEMKTVRLLTEQEALQVSRVHLGSANYTGQGVVVPQIKAIHIHPNASVSPSAVNDIAIIELASPLNFSSALRPLCLVKHFNESLNNKMATISGWGHQFDNTYDDNGQAMDSPKPDVDPERLRDGVAYLISNQQCQEKWNDVSLSERNICLEVGRQHPLHGDSGGPLMINVQTAQNKKWSQIGITSFTRLDTPARMLPIVYTRVNAFCDWIGQTTSNEVTCI